MASFRMSVTNEKSPEVLRYSLLHRFRGLSRRYAPHNDGLDNGVLSFPSRLAHNLHFTFFVNRYEYENCCTCCCTGCYCSVYVLLRAEFHLHLCISRLHHRHYPHECKNRAPERCRKLLPQPEQRGPYNGWRLCTRVGRQPAFLLYGSILVVIFGV